MPARISISEARLSQQQSGRRLGWGKGFDDNGRTADLDVHNGCRHEVTRPLMTGSRTVMVVLPLPLFVLRVAAGLAAVRMVRRMSVASCSYFRAVLRM
jgi:hypothetical protein